MTTAEVLNCAPWRLAAPRALTPYEWSVVYNTVRDEINVAQGGVSPHAAGAATALVNAVRAQRHCPKWTTTAFGPSPAVAVYSYGCLASWWGALPLADSQRALFDITHKGLLCSPQPPWSGCPAAKKDLLFSPQSNSEYATQRGMPAAARNACEAHRNRISYLPLDGPTVARMVKEMKLDPALATLAQSMKPFLLGIQLKPPSGALCPSTTPKSGCLLYMARAMVENVVVITAPGQGIDVTEMVVTGNFDPAKLLALLQRTMPNTLNDWLNQLPGLLGGLPGLQLPGWQQLLDDATEALNRHIEDRATNPQTGTDSGHPLVDSVAGAGASAVSMAEGTVLFLGAAVATALAVVAVGQAKKAS